MKSSVAGGIRLKKQVVLRVKFHKDMTMTERAKLIEWMLRVGEKASAKNCDWSLK